MAEAAVRDIRKNELYSAHDAERYAVVVPELASDEQIKQRAASFIGAVAAGAWLESADEPEALTVKPLESLLDAVQAAAIGNETARKMVAMNAFTDVIERTIKSGHIMNVDLMVDAAGTIQQHGQSMESIQANSLRFAADNIRMKPRIEAEIRNSFRIKHFYDQGVLENYYFVVFSRAADNMTKAEMADAGFYTDTMSCAIQVTSAQHNRLITESAFVAGASNPGAPRHDQATIEQLAAQLGVDVTDNNAAELLDTPLLVHKSWLPQGALNLVEQYDAAAGGTFFGEDKPRQNYGVYRQKCAEREKDFQPKVDMIVAELIAEAPTISSRQMASERLHKISGKHMIELATEDVRINPDVFGRAAAAHIELARWHRERGNVEQSRAEIAEAVQHDRSSSCPSGKATSSDKTGENESSNSSNEADDCTFISKQCPLCHKKNVETTVKKIGNKKHITGSCGCSKTVSAT